MPPSFNAILRTATFLLALLLFSGCASSPTATTASNESAEEEYCWCENSGDQPETLPRCITRSSCSGAFGRGFCLYSCTPES